MVVKRLQVDDLLRNQSIIRIEGDALVIRCNRKTSHLRNHSRRLGIRTEVGSVNSKFDGDSNEDENDEELETMDNGGI